MDKEIINALKKIKEICKNSTCSECPFTNRDEECQFSAETPEDWYLREAEQIRYFD